MAAHMREAIESDGDRLADLHLWRWGRASGAIVRVMTGRGGMPSFNRARLARFQGLRM